MLGSRIRLLLFVSYLAIISLNFAFSGENVLGSGIGSLLGEGIDFKGGMLDWEEDANGNKIAILRNYAHIIMPGVSIAARNIVINVETQEIYAEGDVVFEEENGNAFYCDQITFNYPEWRVLAENITLKVDNKDVVLPTVDFLDEQPSLSYERAGETLRQSGQVKRMFLQAQELRAHDKNTIELIDAKITPSGFAKPHWYFHSPAALLRRNEKLESYHNTVRIGKFPVLYFPYLIRDLQYDWPWMRLLGGYTSDFGVFIKTKWGWKLNPNPESVVRLEQMYLDVDWYSRRGMGFGLETKYSVGKDKSLESIGNLKLYGVYEYGISKFRDLKRALEDNDTSIYRYSKGFEPDLYRRKFRWAVDWEHYQQLNELWDFRAEAHIYHDRDYLREYDPNRYYHSKDPENSIDIRRLDKNWEFEFVAQTRGPNRWLEQAEYLPEVRATLPSLRIGDLPIFIKDDFRMGVVNKRFSSDGYHYSSLNENGLFALDPVTGFSTSRLDKDDDYGYFFRVHNELRLESPLQLGGVATLKPWVGLRTTYYEKTLGTPLPDNRLDPYDYNARRRGFFTPGQLEGNGRGSGRGNYAVPFGVDLSTRTYTLFGSSDQWRWMFEPVVRYEENSRPHLNYSTDILPIDESDVYYRQRKISFEMHNKLQRKDYELASGGNIPVRDVLDLNLKFHYFPRKVDQKSLNYGRKVTEVEVDATYRPINNLALATNILWDTKDGAINRAIVSADWRLSNIFRVYAAHYHYRGNYWRYPSTAPSDQTQLALRTKLWNDSSHYSLEVAGSYEWRRSTDSTLRGLHKYRVSLFRDLDTFELSINYIRDRRKDSHGIFFQLAPKGFMGHERPEPMYNPQVEEVAEGRYEGSHYYASSDTSLEYIPDADLKDINY